MTPRRTVAASLAAVLSALVPAAGEAQQVVSARLEPVVMLSPADAVAVRSLGDDPGEAVVTSDRGASWAPGADLSAAGLSSPAGALCFGTPRVGILVGRDGALLRTSDGGRSWRRHGRAPGRDARSCQLFGGSRGYLVADGRLLFTHDGGRSFRDVAAGLGEVRDACFSDSLRGFVATASGLHVTGSGGRSWTSRLRRPGTAVGCAGTSVWLGTEEGVVLASTDGGLTWSRGAQTGLAGVEWLHFADGRLGFAAGSAGDAARTSDGGRSWVAFELPAEAARPAFLDRGLAYCRGGGALHVSSDLGETWSTEDPDWAPPPSLADLEDQREPDDAGTGPEEGDGGATDVEPGEGESVLVPLGPMGFPAP